MTHFLLNKYNLLATWEIMLLILFPVHTNSTEMQCYASTTPTSNATGSHLDTGAFKNVNLKEMEFESALSMEGIKERQDCHIASNNLPKQNCESKICLKTIVITRESNIRMARFCPQKQWIETYPENVKDGCMIISKYISCSCNYNLCNCVSSVSPIIILIFFSISCVIFNFD